MDQIKTGRFIATCRKEQGLTQSELAEKLGITDRAVSKWETGRSLPDAALMLDLCHILAISATELLQGEKIEMEKQNEQQEQVIIALAEAKEESDKNLLKLEVVIGVFSVVTMFFLILLGAYIPTEDWVRALMICAGFALGLVGIFVALRIEQVAGYYVCAKCGHKHIPTYAATIYAPHMGRTRYMKCPHCEKRSWQKKVISKDENK